jgi:hypothetical protein
VNWCPKEPCLVKNLAFLAEVLAQVGVTDDFESSVTQIDADYEGKPNFQFQLQNVA